jgi:hypothetical protein
VFLFQLFYLERRQCKFLHGERARGQVRQKVAKRPPSSYYYDDFNLIMRTWMSACVTPPIRDACPSV